MKPLRALTLIEVIIVVAIIAVLCAIATPNFLEAQVRAKHSRSLHQLPMLPPQAYPFNTEAYDRIEDNPFLGALENPLSTFSIDVDTASYSNIRRFLNLGQRPPRDAVRIEELVNYFRYETPTPPTETPLTIAAEVGPSPWSGTNRLVRLALRGRAVDWSDRPPCNFVFLIDVSGSMDYPNKLPLVRRSMRTLVDNLDERDRVAIVVYAGTSGLVLPSTNCGDRHTIVRAIDSLEPGGSTNGAAGIQLAYRIAQENFEPGGVNRVILATDGDFNVGSTSQGKLVRLIEDKAQSGVFLTVLGYGMGNLKDSTLEKLAHCGNGNYAYIDSIGEARRALAEQAGGTLLTVAKDVKIQVEFNPARVASWRLIGYENRLLRNEDFTDDTKDAGDLGAGQSVTALYEIVPTSAGDTTPTMTALKYSVRAQAPGAATSGEYLTYKVRYKEPGGHTSRELVASATDSGNDIESASSDFRFAAAVAAFGMLLRESPHKGSADFDLVRTLARGAFDDDPHRHCTGFLKLVDEAEIVLAQ